ncbi:MAG: DNA alkylation repair protein [Bacteroidales bacterium]
MEISETLRLIKTDFRRGMNGIVAASMRGKGINYKVNFGLTLPVIRSLAAKYDKEALLAESLWSEDIRESKLLAPMLYPVDEMNIKTARRWIDEIPYNEISDICCMVLFCKLSFAGDLALECIESQNSLKRYLGITLLNRLTICGTEIEYPLTSILKNLQADGNPAIASAANNLSLNLDKK